MTLIPSDSLRARRLDTEQAQAQLELKDRALAASAEGITIADARLSFSELSRRVHLSPPAVAEPLKRVRVRDSVSQPRHREIVIRGRTEASRSVGLRAETAAAADPLGASHAGMDAGSDRGDCAAGDAAAVSRW